MRVRMRLAARAGAVLGAVALAAAMLPASPAQAAGEVIIVWADPIRASVLQREFAGGFQGATVQVVVKDS
ncbi:MAG: hypothetical protein KGP12_03095, partial [Actinomycetales bacterium]|nr:hypothetical protein [Actinomycetales bacterium]